MLKSLIKDVPYPAIDGIRFYAAFVVFIEHTLGEALLEYYGIPGVHLNRHFGDFWFHIVAYIQDGNHGVDVFFIISGFLMSRIIFNTARDFSYGNFLVKRINRIYPAFFVSLVVAALLRCLCFGWPWSATDFLKAMVLLNAIPHYLRAYNFVSWSLGFEFAFYAVIPVLLLISPRVDKRLAAGLMLVVASALLATDYIRMIGLFVGAFIGAFDDVQLQGFAKRIPLLPVMALYVLCGICKGWAFSSFTPYFVCFLTVASVLFVKIGWDGANRLSRFFASAPMRGLGTLSYSIYLYHTLAAPVVLYYLTPWPASTSGMIWYMVASFALTIAVSFVSYMAIEHRYFSPVHTKRQVTV